MAVGFMVAKPEANPYCSAGMDDITLVLFFGLIAMGGIILVLVAQHHATKCPAPPEDDPHQPAWRRIWEKLQGRSR